MYRHRPAIWPLAAVQAPRTAVRRTSGKRDVIVVPETSIIALRQSRSARHFSHMALIEARPAAASRASRPNCRSGNIRQTSYLKQEGAMQQRASSSIGTEYLMTLHAPLEPPQLVSSDLQIYTSLHGGWVKGPAIRGELVPPGGDWLRSMPQWHTKTRCPPVHQGR